MESVISWLQRVINTGAIERWARSIGIQLPIIQLLKEAIINIVPYGQGNTVYNYIASNIDKFKTTPASVIAADLKKSGVNFKLSNDLTFTLFGQKITIPAEQSSDAAKYILYGLVGIITIAILSGKGNNAAKR